MRLRRGRSLPVITERWVDTVESYSPFDAQSTPSWHEFTGATKRQKRRASFDAARRARRKRALAKVSRIVLVLARFERRTQRESVRAKFSRLKAVTDEIRRAELRREFELRSAMREKRVTTMLVAGSDQILKMFFMLWLQHMEEAKELDRRLAAEAEMPAPDKGEALLKQTRSVILPQCMVKYCSLDQAFEKDATHAAGLARDRELMQKNGVSFEDYDKAKGCFAEIDIDRSGLIDRSEFEHLICNMLGAKDKYDIPASRMSTYWSFCDVKRTGGVDFPDFLVWWTKYGQNLGKANLLNNLRGGRALRPQVTGLPGIL